MNRETQSGFSLIEAVVALALLAAVLLSISGLFVYGRQSVGTGKDLTEATSLATQILEEMNGWGFSQIYTNFGKAETDVAFSVDSKTNAFAQKWQPGVDAHLANGKATIAVTPLGGSTFATGQGARIQVTVDWTIRQRPRKVSLETVRF